MGPNTIPIPGGRPLRANLLPVMDRTPRRVTARYFAYLLRCGDGTFYAGYTIDLDRRLDAHRRGGARYTRGRGPWEFAAVWRCPTRRAALRLERLLKRVGRPRRLQLAQGAPLSALVPAAVGLGARRVILRGA
ncbi:MAG TPA: GIY-YIG nuclease family protein [bacterium]|nr:GIY-YIG nuclease family protein [bacterium]